MPSLGLQSRIFHQAKNTYMQSDFPILPSSGGEQGEFRCVFLCSKVLIPSVDCQYQNSLPKERVR